MARKDALGFELDKNDFVKLTKSNATLAQNKVDASASNSTDKKAAKTRKTLSAIREDDFSKNDLYQLMQKNATGNFANGFLDVIKTINDEDDDLGCPNKYFPTYRDAFEDIKKDKKIKTGDTILFKCGDTFFGSVVTTNNSGIHLENTAVQSMSSLLKAMAVFSVAFLPVFMKIGGFLFR